MLNEIISKKIKNLSNIQFLFFSLIISIIYLIYNILFSLIFKNYLEYNSSSQIILNSTFLIIYSIFFAPFIETFIFQFIIIKFLNKKFKSYLFGILISAFTFNIFHNFTYLEHIAFIPISLFFPYIFYIYDKANKNAFLRVSFIHFTINFLLIGSSLL